MIKEFRFVSRFDPHFHYLFVTKKTRAWNSLSNKIEAKWSFYMTIDVNFVFLILKTIVVPVIKIK